MLTHAHTRSQMVLEKQTHDQVIELQITFQESTIGQNLSPRNTKSTTTQVGAFYKYLILTMT